MKKRCCINDSSSDDEHKEASTYETEDGLTTDSHYVESTYDQELLSYRESVNHTYHFANGMNFEQTNINWFTHCINNFTLNTNDVPKLLMGDLPSLLVVADVQP